MEENWEVTEAVTTPYFKRLKDKPFVREDKTVWFYNSLHM
jgi:hypothetical protein